MIEIYKPMNYFNSRFAWEFHENYVNYNLINDNNLKTRMTTKSEISLSLIFILTFSRIDKPNDKFSYDTFSYNSFILKTF